MTKKRLPKDFILLEKPMLFDFCTNCGKGQGQLLCEECLEMLTPLPQIYKNPLLQSAYRYQGIIRNLVFRAKVFGDLRALVTLVELCTRSPYIEEISPWVDTVMPVPSSLWSRLRGKTDLGGILALEVARTLKKPLSKPPRHLFWRLKKRAQETGRIQENLIQRRGEGAPRRILLVDDVITTGSSLNRVAASLSGNLELRYFTLASAYGNQAPKPQII